VRRWAEMLAVVGTTEHYLRQASGDERLLGSSEVLESMIGKFKNVAGERGQHGLTGMVLSIGALVGKQPVSTVQTAMTETTTQQVWDWCRSHLGPTVQSVRAKIRHALNPEQKRNHYSLKATDPFKLPIRAFMRRFTRLPLGFSKRLENLSATVALYVAYRNFCWRARKPGKGGRRRLTPAMAAKLIDKLWALEDLLGALCHCCRSRLQHR